MHHAEKTQKTGFWALKRFLKPFRKKTSEKSVTVPKITLKSHGGPSRTIRYSVEVS